MPLFRRHELGSYGGSLYIYIYQHATYGSQIMMQRLESKIFDFQILLRLCYPLQKKQLPSITLPKEMQISYFIDQNSQQNERKPL